MSAISVDGDLVHYEVLGRGRPVILLHTWVGSWRYWVSTMRHLHLKYRVYALDLFGYGDSARNPQRYGLGAQVQLLEVFMREMGITKSALIGHGLGAQVALEFASRYPDRVARLMLTGAPLFDPGDLHQRLPEAAPPIMPVRPVEVSRPSPFLRINRPLASKHPVDYGYSNGRHVSDETIVSSANGTISNASLIDRERLQQAALERRSVVNPPIPSASSGPNPLALALNGDISSMETLLGRCFRRSESEFEKLRVDATRADDEVLRQCAQDFDAGRTLDMLRLLPMPAVVVHGLEDPLIPAPDEAIWDYLTADKDDSLLPFALPGVRHFPMLEHDPFQQLVGKFLETPDISKIELKERWRRRSR